MADVQDLSGDTAKETGGGFVKKSIALKLKSSKKDDVQMSASPRPETEPVEEEVPPPPPVIDPSVIAPPVLQQDECGFATQKGLDLKWDFPINQLGQPVTAPKLSLCPECEKAVLIYGRMKKCKHAFCRDCAKKSGGTCPKCNEPKQEFEEALMGNLYICCHGGGRYDNKGCGNTYRSPRDLEAHVQFRHHPHVRPQAPNTVINTNLPATNIPYSFNPVTMGAMHPGLMRPPSMPLAAAKMAAGGPGGGSQMILPQTAVTQSTKQIIPRTWA